MPRPLRRCPGGLVYHVLNRAVGRRQIFFKDPDYAAFERVLAQAIHRTPAMELFTYCLMPNHWHLVLRPAADGQLSHFMRWLTVTHTQRWHAHHHTAGTGHLYQGRFKSFPCEADDAHFLALCRYVERNPLRARLADRAELWRWTGLWRRTYADPADHPATDGSPPAPAAPEIPPLSPWPVEPPVDWLARVNRPQPKEQEDALRQAVRRGRPFGGQHFVTWTTAELGLQTTFRKRGRPPKHALTTADAVR
jgi:putative transposase